MDQRPIGVFDSGSGGLTAVREIRSILPSENIIYFGDTSRVPYGGRSPEILLHYARQDVHFLRSFDVKALLVACGTVSTNALPVLAAESDIPILGVVEPACAAAAAAIYFASVVKNYPKSPKAYERTLAAMDSTITVYAGACPLFVPLVENGRFRPGDTVIETVAREYLTPLRDTGIDTLILGCTHYPLLAEVIAGVMGSGVTLIDSGASAARALRQTLSDKDLLAQRASGTLTLYASDQPQDFGALAPQFLRRPLEGAVLPVDIERY